MKYYAVKCGKVPGVYASWDQCKAQVTGFSGAVYKSFGTMQEAKAFAFPENEKEKEEEEEQIIEMLDTVHIYTDASNQRSKGYLGIGAWCRYNRKEYRMSKECTPKFLKKYGIEEYTVSNPTAEFLAYAEILSKFRNVEGINVTFYIDYIGVREWMSGAFKTDKPYIKKIKEFCDGVIKDSGCKFNIVHIRGHTGIEGNEYADEMAGSDVELDEFDRLVKVIIAEN